ncbi:unnamed protein product [Microthlaspi erraticum]|uniref:Uncharacterized protein n=1 Tax=Microthlaspi erraticum TaxID=1685480 RepID=A0A6D2J3A0_9BRAS|nr:unnamed protein product [Microthlaspi erraticum]
MEGLGAWTQLNWIRKGRRRSHLEDQLDHYSTNRSSSSTRPAKLQLDRAEKSKSNPKNSSRVRTLTFAPFYTLVGHEDDLREEEPELDRAEDRAEARAEDEPKWMRIWTSDITLRSMKAPRMNPSVVAVTRGLDFSKSSTSGKGKPLRKCKSPWTRWSRSLLTTPRRLPAQEPHRASSFEPREEGDNTQRNRKSSKPDAPTRPPDSIESKQRKLNSIELMVELTWRSQFREPWI